VGDPFLPCITTLYVLRRIWYSFSCCLFWDSIGSCSHGHVSRLCSRRSSSPEKLCPSEMALDWTSHETHFFLVFFALECRSFWYIEPSANILRSLWARLLRCSLTPISQVRLKPLLLSNSALPAVLAHCMVWSPILHHHRVLTRWSHCSRLCFLLPLQCPRPCSCCPRWTHPQEEHYLQE
jgi:hypothetical protein